MPHRLSLGISREPSASVSNRDGGIWSTRGKGAIGKEDESTWLAYCMSEQGSWPRKNCWLGLRIDWTPASARYRSPRRLFRSRVRCRIGCAERLLSIPWQRFLRDTTVCRENRHAPEERYKQTAPAGNRDANRRELGDASFSRRQPGSMYPVPAPVRHEWPAPPYPGLPGR